MNDAMKDAVYAAYMSSDYGDQSTSFYAGFEACHDILRPILKEVMVRGLWPQSGINMRDDLVERIKAVLKDSK